jgi:hypothetical protein
MMQTHGAERLHLPVGQDFATDREGASRSDEARLLSGCPSEIPYLEVLTTLAGDLPGSCMCRLLIMVSTAWVSAVSDFA